MFIKKHWIINMNITSSDENHLLELQSWCLGKTYGSTIEILKPQLKTIYYQCIKIYFEYMYPYLKCLENHKLQKDKSVFASGFIFFIGGLCIVMHYENWGNYIEAICWYNTLYLLFDFYIDSEYIPELDKLILIEILRVTLKEKDKVWSMDEINELNDPVISTLYETYWKLIEKYPNTKYFLQKIFKVQKRSYFLSKENKNVTQEDLYTIAVEKGGYTMMVFYAIVGEERREIIDTFYNLGVLMQLLDDFMDMEKDKKIGIETYATYCLSKKELSSYWYTISKQILAIHPFFTLFKIIYSILLLYISCCIVPYLELNQPIYDFCSNYNIFQQNINTRLEDDTFLQYKKMKSTIVVK
jgi:hypothetical protein